MQITGKFFTLIRLAAGLQREISPDFYVHADEWSVLFDMAEKQTVVGLLLEGAQRLNESNYPPKALLFKMMALTKRAEQRNYLLDEKCKWLTQQFEQAGLGSCILKGQGIAALYPNPSVRASGDIDIWLHKDGRNINRFARSVIRQLRQLNTGKVGKATYHHLDWELGDVSVEVHYRPQAFNNPLVNHRFQKWCNEQWKDRAKCKGFYIPSADFNAVYLLVHLFHHLLFEGVGLRQVCDYAVFLNSCAYNHPLAEKHVRAFGMTRFARGMMWVLHEELHLGKEKMFVQPDEQEGRFILSEILKAGNFGKFDKRIDHSLSGSVEGKFYLRTKHRARFVFRYPSEIIWDIPFRLYHWFWRKCICSSN